MLRYIHSSLVPITTLNHNMQAIIPPTMNHKSLPNFNTLYYTLLSRQVKREKLYSFFKQYRRKILSSEPIETCFLVHIKKWMRIQSCRDEHCMPRRLFYGSFCFPYFSSSTIVVKFLILFNKCVLSSSITFNMHSTCSTFPFSATLSNTCRWFQFQCNSKRLVTTSAVLVSIR